MKDGMETQTEFADLQARIRDAKSPEELSRIADELRERSSGAAVALAADPSTKETMAAEKRGRTGRRKAR